MMLVVKWRFGWCLSPRRRHLKTPRKRKSRVETFLHYCDLVLSSTVNSVDSIYRLTLIVNQHRSRWNLVTSVFVLLRLRHIRATLKPSSSISSWRQATKIPTPAHDLVFKQLRFKFSFSTLNAHSSNPLPMLGHVFRTKLLSPDICIVYQYRCQWASSSSILVILFNILSEISDWHKFIWGTDTSINQSKTAPWEEKTQVFTQFKITHLVIFEGLKV